MSAANYSHVLASIFLHLGRLLKNSCQFVLIRIEILQSCINVLLRRVDAQATNAGIPLQQAALRKRATGEQVVNLGGGGGGRVRRPLRWPAAG